LADLQFSADGLDRGAKVEKSFARQGNAEPDLAGAFELGEFAAPKGWSF